MSRLGLIAVTTNVDEFGETREAMVDDAAKGIAIFCSWTGLGWEPLFAIDYAGDVIELPSCFRLNAEAILMLDALRKTP